LELGGEAMKKIVLLAFVVLVAWIVYSRARIFVRDPGASVYLNNVKQTGVQVFINFDNDVLLEKDSEPGAYRTLAQHWDMAAATPASLICVRWMACLTGADHAPMLPIDWKGQGKYDPHVNMSGRIVTFVDSEGGQVRVEL
jgi:hypothetical protein